MTQRTRDLREKQVCEGWRAAGKLEDGVGKKAERWPQVVRTAGVAFLGFSFPVE